MGEHNERIVLHAKIATPSVVRAARPLHAVSDS